ncbi:MAG: hypothetical protein NDP13_00595 [Crenarchaeota archaeon]|nr:hypothetical protein [Thermoproteota archaeon]MCR8453483.1 hypothetical protein [Thermoproteota archaeon]MCR8454872.1 hypothetical protein [Thermoproteota archaeon]MCR8462758.1 hypothetical protein [Thermoproteota archaeon]MCR8470547.1 hypothetical protein [Thermoproteota archaeon]
MIIKYLEAWLNSPYVGRRRKALKLLGKYAIQGKYDRKKLFEEAKKALSDEDWKIRAVAVNVIADIAIVEDSLRKEIHTILLDCLKKEEHPNVLGNVLRGISRIINKGVVDNTDEIFKIGVETIKHPNGDIKHGSILLLSQIAIQCEDKVGPTINAISEVISDLPPLVKRDALRYSREIYTKYPEAAAEFLRKSTINALSDESHLVLEEALRNLAVLIRDRKVQLENDTIMMLRKKLRSEKAAIRMAALDVVDAILSIDPRLADAYLDIIGKQILLREKNSRVKIKALELLLRQIDRIPQDLIYRSELLRVLDVVDLNTVPKNDELKTIKRLTRILLENKLGLDFAARARLRSS